MKAAVLLRRMKDACEAAYESVKDAAYDEFKTYGSKEVGVEGAVVKEYPGRATYSYEGIVEHELAKARIKEIEDRHKLAYRLISDGKVQVHEGCAVMPDGELVKPCSAKFTQPSIAISFK